MPFAVLNPESITTLGLAFSHFARRYFGNLFWFLFLRLLRCFSSAGLPAYTYFIQYRLTGYCPAGFPHSDIRGSMLICSSPRLFAAYHVLLRLLMPRHSPCALLRLTSSAQATLCSFLFSQKTRLLRCASSSKKTSVFLEPCTRFARILSLCLCKVKRSLVLLSDFYVSKLLILLWIVSQLPFVHFCTRVLSEKTCIISNASYLVYSHILLTLLFIQFSNNISTMWWLKTKQ